MHRSGTILTRLLLPLLLLTAALAFAACGDSGSDGDATAAAGTPATTAGTAAKPRTFKLGVGADNPQEGAIAEFIKKEVGPAHGVDLKIVELGDSVAINQAVQGGELDGHFAQPWYYLKAIKDENGWDLGPATPVYVSRFALFSKKYRSIDEIPEGATIAIPDDPTSQARSLGILAKNGLIEIDPNVDQQLVSVRDVTSNPKKIKWKQIVIAQIARVLPDVDAAIATYSRFTEAGTPADQLILKSEDDPAVFGTQLILKEKNLKNPDYKPLIDAFADPKVAAFITKEFGEFQTALGGRS